MRSIEIGHFLREPKTIFSEPLSIQAHQSSKTRQEKETGHLLRVHYVM